MPLRRAVSTISEHDSGSTHHMMRFVHVGTLSRGQYSINRLFAELKMNRVSCQMQSKSEHGDMMLSGEVLFKSWTKKIHQGRIVQKWTRKHGYHWKESARRHERRQHSFINTDSRFLSTFAVCNPADLVVAVSTTFPYPLLRSSKHATATRFRTEYAYHGPSARDISVCPVRQRHV